MELSAGSGKHLSIPFAKKGHVVTASEYAAKACKNIDRIVAMHDVQIEILEIDFRNLLIPISATITYLLDIAFRITCL